MDHFLITTRLSQPFEKLGLDARDCLRKDGRCSLSHEGGRLDIYPMPDGRLVFETRIMDLPDEPNARQHLMERALSFSTSRMKIRDDTLALSQEGDALLLQHAFSIDRSPFDMATEIEEFLNAGDHWKRILATSSHD